MAEGVPTPAQVLEHRGMRPDNVKLSGVWQCSTLGRILSNPAYAGQHSAWRRQHTRVTVVDETTGKRVRRDRVVPRENASDVSIS